MKCLICGKDSIFINKICRSCGIEICKVKEGLLGVTEPYISPLKTVNKMAQRNVLENE